MLQLNSDESTALMKVEVTLVEQTYCSELYEKIERPVYPVQFCTHDVGTVRKSVCTVSLENHIRLYY